VLSVACRTPDFYPDSIKQLVSFARNPILAVEKASLADIACLGDQVPVWGFHRSARSRCRLL
jgi:hypothetical protein